MAKLFETIVLSLIILMVTVEAAVIFVLLIS